MFFVVLSPFLSVNEAVERKQMLADWLVKRNDLLIQKVHMFWLVVCWNNQQFSIPLVSEENEYNRKSGGDTIHEAE